MRKLRTWKGSDHKWIRENWQQLSDREMAAHFDVTLNAMVLQRRRIGIKRPVNTSHLLPGFPTQWNASRKEKPFWTTAHGKPVQMIVKYEPGKPRITMLYTRYLWIKEHGPVPKGMVVAARNGDIHDRTPGNIFLATRAEVGRMMQARRPKELCKAIRAKQVQTLRLRKKVAAYTEHKPYQFAA